MAVSNTTNTNTRQKSAVVDKWKKKKKYIINASKHVGSIELGETVAEKPEQVIGRTIKVNLGTITNQARKKNVDVTFKVKDVQGTNANTELSGFELKSSYLRRLFRRRSSKIEAVQYVVTKDKRKIKVKTVIVTARKVQREKRKDVRRMIEDLISKLANENSLENFFGIILEKDIFAQVHNEMKKIVAVKKSEIEEIKVVG